MNGPGPGRGPFFVLIAGGLTLLSLGLRWNLLQRGYQVNVRVLVAGAAIALGFAAVSWATRPERARVLLDVATVLLVAAVVLRLRGIHPSALITGLAAIGATVLARRRLPARAGP